MSKVEDETTIAGIRATIAGLEADKTHHAGPAAARRGPMSCGSIRSLKAGLVTKSRRSIRPNAIRASFEASVIGKGWPDLESSRRTNPVGAAADSRQGRSRRQGAPRARAGERRHELARASHQHGRRTRDRAAASGRRLRAQQRKSWPSIEPPSTNIEPVVCISSASGKAASRRGWKCRCRRRPSVAKECGFMKGQIRHGRRCAGHGRRGRSR